VVKLLIERGADVNAKEINGWTALMIALGEGHEEIVELLKSYEAKGKIIRDIDEELLICL
jgi:ankyrin repeat protein